MMVLLKRILRVRFFMAAKMRIETPHTNMASVESMNGAPRMAPTPISSPASALPNRIAMIGMTVSGSAVPTAARTLPTAPSPRCSLRPNHSTPLQKSSHPARMTRKATMSRKTVIREILLNAGHGPQVAFAISSRLLKIGVSLPGRDGHARDEDEKSVAHTCASSAIVATEDEVARRPVRSGGRDSVLQQPPSFGYFTLRARGRG